MIWGKIKFVTDFDLIYQLLSVEWNETAWHSSIKWAAHQSSIEQMMQAAINAPYPPFTYIERSYT